MSSSSERSQSQDTRSNNKQKFSDSGKPLPAVGLKWGRTPNAMKSEPDTSVTTGTETKPDFANYYTPEEQAKLRAKGINPTLKAEMEWSKKQSEGKGFWGKLAQTSMGGGWIK